MKTLFNKTTCPTCGKAYDPAEGHCPSCGAENKLPERGRSWDVTIPMGLGEEIALFITGSAGLVLISTILQLVIQSLAKSAYSAEGITGEALINAMNAFVKTAAYVSYVNIGAYIILFVALLFVLGRNIYRLNSLFKKGSTYLGFVIGIGMMIITTILSMLLKVSSNANQSAVEGVESYAPLASLIVLGIIGPFCEEITYRVGLYNTLKRFNWIFALFVTSFIFASIHFDWSNAASLNEWKNFPIYFSMGLILTYTYEKYGFGASFLAHFTNNFVGVLLTIIASHLQ
jgi:membrane protease YdiL (CAAX protease family)